MSVWRNGRLGVHPPWAALFVQAQGGRDENRNQVMACHDGVVQAIVHRQVLCELPFEETLAR